MNHVLPTQQSSIGKEAGPDLEYFYKLGGEYNVTLGRWMKASSQTNVLLTRLSTIAEIEGAGNKTGTVKNKACNLTAYLKVNKG